MSTQQKTLEGLCEKAADNYFTAFRSGLKLQEEMAQRFTELVKSGGLTGGDGQSQYRKKAEEVVSSAEEIARDSFEAVEKNVKECQRLLSEGIQASQNAGAENAQARFTSLWQDSLTSFVDGVQSMVRVNSNAMKAYADLFENGTEKTGPKNTAKAGKAK